MNRELRPPIDPLQGVLDDGQQIAVKKLSLGSRQGVREFLNEVRLLLKVQHRNLVSLLGCCASSGHKMLVYPYFPNGSLDHILFSKKSSACFSIKRKNYSAFCYVYIACSNIFFERYCLLKIGCRPAIMLLLQHCFADTISVS
jgi:serine/threonine protein kinase